MKRPAFEGLVGEALETIPRRFRDAMVNIAIIVEDEPSDDLLEEMEIDPPDTLLGLYQGIPLTERRSDYGNTLPDRILLFQGPLERESEDEDDLVVAIGETLIHEIGHYFGLSEEEIEEIEEKYWHSFETEDAEGAEDAEDPE
jgi:predicted Zn-dependent protease with MMP-like domain